MTASLVLDNLLAWSAQVTVLVAVGAVAAMTLGHPRARLLFWQGILAIALLLPAVEPWHQPAMEDAGAVALAVSAAPVTLVHQPALRFGWKREYFLVLLAAGAGLRFLWIGAGLMRLRRHRLDARMLTIPPVRFSNPRVRWFVSSTVGGPVTFGFLNPSILLPTRVAELPDDLREAIAHHELAHVRRRDWLFVLAEESIRSLLWFHPAVWFVLSRIQLAREQVVDAEVVGLTHDRERYLDALVAVAAQRLLPDVAPAPLFLKKRQLAVRVAAVLKETRMTKSRTFLNLTTVCSAALIAVRLAVWMFPMQAPAQTRAVEKGSLVADGPGVVVEPGAKILHRSPVFYPSGVTTAGTVVVESTVNAKGEVTDARVISGPDELRNAALSSVLNWHFSTSGGLGSTVQSVIRFEHGANTPVPTTVRAVPAATSTSLYLKSINFIGLSDELADKVRASLPVHIGDAFGNDQIAQVEAAIKDVDEHLMYGIRNTPPDAMLTIILRPDGIRGGITGGIPGGVSEGVGTAGRLIEDRGALAQPATELPPPANGVQRIRVGGMVEANNLVMKVTPVYPPLAKQARIQGTVRFTALIGADGNVVSLQLVEGHPLLVASAREAVAQWQYKPTLLNGNAAEVITQIDVNYTLSQ
ncbi:MAG TPA: TonB family protein [Bryobacteraceae bacterium]|jgi:TonB family protein|nr:TonB family protein [Bryobacteraceae bacterium]